MANINITQIRMKRGNTAAASTYTGPLGELLVDTGLQTVRVQDGTTPGGMTTLATNVQIQTLSTAISNINANAGGNYSNANVASYLPTTSIITGINANVTAANLAISVLQSNAATQETSINSINANVTAANVQITDLWSNAATQANSIIGANAAIVTSNTAMKSYVDAVTTAWTANAATQATSINSINANIGGSQIYANTLVNSITANLGAYQTFANANAASQSASIATLQTQVYTNSNVATYLLSSFIGIGVLTTSGNLTVGGNLIVNGNTTVINTASYTVEDNIIQMADGNPADSLDLGFIAHRTVNSTLQHTGLVRDSSAGNWKLFSNVTAQPGATVDFTNAVYDGLVVGNVNATSLTLYSPGQLQFTDACASPLSIGAITSVGNIQFSDGSSYIAGNYGRAVLANVVSTNGFFWSNGTAYSSGSGTYSNASVATYLSNYDGGINFTASPAVITGLGNISSANFTFANGVNILSTVNAGGSYANADVATYLAANSAIYLGNPVTRYPNQANVTQMFVGNTTTIGAGYNQLGGTYILNNAYFGANGAMYARNTQTGAAQLSVGSGSFNFAGTTGAVTANSVQSFALWGQLNSSGLVTYNGIGITSAGTLTVQGASGLVTSQTTGALFNTTATTINLGGAATAINMGTSATNPVVTLGSSGTGTLVLGNATATGSFTASGNVTAASVTTLGSGGNISGVGNIVGITSNTTITAGAYVTSFLSNGAVINNTGSVVATVITTTPTTVGALPAAATSGAGARAFVTDANSTTFGAAAVGGSTNKVPVYSDGSAWYIG